jgi:hypothetical protein
VLVTRNIHTITNVGGDSFNGQGDSTMSLHEKDRRIEALCRELAQWKSAHDYQKQLNGELRTELAAAQKELQWIRCAWTPPEGCSSDHYRMRF